MPIIKFVNLDYRKAYRYPQDIGQLLNYIAKPNATEYPPNSDRYLIGAAPDIICTHQPDAAIRMENLFLRLYELYPSLDISLLRHYVVSFGNDERIAPEMAYALGKEIVCYYFNQGYISFFGVHLDTDNLHIHIAVSMTNWKNGSSFWIYDDILKLEKGVEKWYQRYISGNRMPLFACTIEEFEEDPL